ncbi:hypothetical protein KEG38_26430 [Polyangium jinanense]|uniref:hypothetical protein n=1 Tax=Polyangium jinanense TaxID=2829994 RepID=UPI0023427292|nr:hypothetical protein [Polyangium jinanense]MDC3957422.1 hypothetical protein [Polyangium jinanense]
MTAWLRAQGPTDIEASVHTEWKTLDGLLNVLAEEEARAQRARDPRHDPFLRAWGLVRDEDEG